MANYINEDVVLISPSKFYGPSGEWYDTNLTVGRVYKVVAIDILGDFQYLIEDNNGITGWHSAKYFMPLSEYRNKLISNIIDESDL